jgi:hypothetical protein
MPEKVKPPLLFVIAVLVPQVTSTPLRGDWFWSKTVPDIVVVTVSGAGVPGLLLSSSHPLKNKTVETNKAKEIQKSTRAFFIRYPLMIIKNDYS